MKLPRDLSADELIRALRQLGYQPTRQKGSHIRLTTTQNGEHHVTIPNHQSLRVRTLASILDDVAEHFQLTRDELRQQLRLLSATRNIAAGRPSPETRKPRRNRGFEHDCESVITPDEEYRRWESNPHIREGYGILNPARLPFRHSG